MYFQNCADKMALFNIQRPKSLLQYSQDRVVKYKSYLTNVLNATFVELEEQALYFRFRGFLNI